MTEVLELSTIVERRTVNIKSKQHPAGKLYEIRGSQELSVWDIAQVELLSTRMREVDFTSKPTEARERAFRKHLRDLVAIIVPSLEKPVVAAMSDTHLLAIFAVWGNERGADGGVGNASSVRTSGASSRGSNGSTAATPKRGSTTRSGS